MCVQVNYRSIILRLGIRGRRNAIVKYITWSGFIKIKYWLHMFLPHSREQCDCWLHVHPFFCWSLFYIEPTIDYPPRSLLVVPLIIFKPRNDSVRPN